MGQVRSSLTGNEFVKLKQIIRPYPKDSIIAWDWSGVDLSKESQGVSPKIIDSIQYKVIERLLHDDVDIIYDDDYSGEIADVITIKQHTDKLLIKFYHLKYARNGLVNNEIENLYQVCGQTQKSIHWKHKGCDEIIHHLLRREPKKRGTAECSRIMKGTNKELERLLGLAKNRIPLDFEIYLVQPSISKQNVSNEILTLLGATENYLMEFGKIRLHILASA